MKITLLGCGTSVGVPALGPMGWGRCNPDNPRNRRQRCALLIEKDDFVLLVDAGPDIRNQLLAAGVKRLDAVLITHTHSDHVAGMDDLRSFYFVDQTRLPIYATATDLDTIQDRFSYLFFKHSGSPNYFQPSLTGHVIEAGSAFSLGGVHIRTLLQYHGRANSLGFVFDGQLGYSTDVIDMPDASFDYLKALDVWVVESLRDEPHQAHAHFDLALSWIETCQPKRAILTHLGAEADYDEVLSRCPKHVEPGYDGLVITL